MSEPKILISGGVYQSPISQFYKDVEYKFKEDMENKIVEAVHHFGISVDKEELIKALQYDRNQYDKGYADGRANIIEELEKIKSEIIACTQQEEGEVPACINYGIKLSTEIVEKHLVELKGENKECSTCKSDYSHEDCLGCIEYAHWKLKGE